jgi:hypothetical protein
MFDVLYHDRSYRPKKHARVASHTDTGKCCVELTMHEDIAAQVENSFVQFETLATVEGCCICRSCWNKQVVRTRNVACQPYVSLCYMSFVFYILVPAVTSAAV